MVEEQKEEPMPSLPNDCESDNGNTSALQWTAQLVQNLDRRLRQVVSADELKKLSIDNAKQEFKKVLQ